MVITLYSTGCPKCHVLEAKLKQKNINYDLCTDVDVMQSKGMMSAPALEVDGNLMDFGSAVKWVNNYSSDTIENTVSQDDVIECNGSCDL